jgi:hypothetical protein
MVHHGTIRKYVAALLDFFNGLEIQYEDSNGNTVSRNIPIKYSSQEKARVLDSYTAEQLSSGNTNVLPRAALAMSTLVKSEQRTKNKNVKIATIKTDDTFEYMYNSVPYEFTFELSIMCRGMNEACMIIEQIAPKFNPTVNIDVWDASNLDEPTRVPVKLLDIGIEAEDYEELSSNLMSVNIGLSIMGNLYPPIKSIDRVKDFKMYLNQQDGNFYSKKSIMGWDVLDDGSLTNETLTQVTDTTTYAPNIISIVPVGTIGLGQNNLEVIYEDKDNKLTELSFDWTVLSGSAVVVGDLDKAQLDISAAGNVEVQVTITDPFGNYNSLSTTLSV